MGTIVVDPRGRGSIRGVLTECNSALQGLSRVVEGQNKILQEITSQQPADVGIILSGARLSITDRTLTPRQATEAVAQIEEARKWAKRGVRLAGLVIGLITVLLFLGLSVSPLGWGILAAIGACGLAVTVAYCMKRNRILKEHHLQDHTSFKTTLAFNAFVSAGIPWATFMGVVHGLPYLFSTIA